jgi:hypothetical protein
MVEELISGTAIVLEVSAPQAAFREFVGPHDPVRVSFNLYNTTNYSKIFFIYTDVCQINL